MKTTKAQDALLEKLADGWQVSFKSRKYVLIRGEQSENMWPSTFYGLFENRLVEKDGYDNFVLSDEGRKFLDAKERN